MLWFKESFWRVANVFWMKWAKIVDQKVWKSEKLALEFIHKYSYQFSAKKKNHRFLEFNLPNEKSAIPRFSASNSNFGSIPKKLRKFLDIKKVCKHSLMIPLNDQHTRDIFSLLFHRFCCCCCSIWIFQPVKSSSSKMISLRFCKMSFLSNQFVWIVTFTQA